MKPKTIFFDFDGVLTKDRFYSTCLKEYPQICDYVNNNIFQGEQKIGDKWMRGEFTYKQINKMISDSTKIPVKTINHLLIESVKLFEVENELIKYAKTFKSLDISIALVTNNMDIFNEIIIPNLKLNEIFPQIVNSFDYGVLKHEQNGKLFDIALSKLKIDSYENVLLIDDSEKSCNTFSSRGGLIYQYKDLNSFKEWVNIVKLIK